MTPRGALAVIALLLVVRAVAAALLPLSADEAYYLLWSHHLQAGYYDHPPAIAFLIRAGAFLLGDTPFGVRAAGLLLSIPATFFVWDMAALILKDVRKAALAAVFFNLTLMIAVEMMVATPDMPSIVTVAAFVWAIARAQASGNGRWWLAAGAAAGLSLLSKYSAFFAGLGVFVWLLADARARRWFRTPWPWAGGALAGLIFAPHLVWQSQQDWMTFAFQFGRVQAGHPTARYLAEFIGAQLGLATPLILVLATIGFWRARRRGDDRFLLFVPVTVALLYFLQHAIHDRVQGNWPCFLYPLLAVLAADAMDAPPRWLARGAMPVAAILLALVYGQALFGLVPLKNDPAARLLMRDFPAAARRLDGAVVTSEYQTTALLKLYRPDLQVIQVNDPQRYLWAGNVTADQLRGHITYFAEARRAQPDLLRDRFGTVAEPSTDGRYLRQALAAPRPGIIIGKAP